MCGGEGNCLLINSSKKSSNKYTNNVHMDLFYVNNC